MTRTLAVALAGLATMVWVSRPSPLGRLGRAGWPVPASSLLRPPPWAVTCAGTVAGAVTGFLLAGPVGAVGGGLAVPAGRWWLDRRRGRRARARREDDVAEACVALAGELASGVPAGRALVATAAEWPELFGPAAGRAVLGGNPAEAFRETARLPGAGALRAVAAAWEVSERTGAGLSTVLVAVADSLRSAATVRREADAQLASVRATARLMAGLPVATLLLFSAGGGGALGFLTGTSSGLVCLVLAVLFVTAGLVWVDRTSRGLRSVWER